MKMDRSAGLELERLHVNRHTFCKMGVAAATAEHFHHPAGEGYDEQQRQQQPVNRKRGEESHLRRN